MISFPKKSATGSTPSVLKPLRRISGAVALLGMFTSTATGDEVAQFIRLVEAARMGEMAEVRAALDDGAPLNQGDYYLRTPLMQALDAGQTDVARFLIEKGADVNAVCSDWTTRRLWTPLAFAIATGDESIVQHLLTKGAKVHLKREGDEVPPPSPAEVAFAYDLPGMLQLLSKHGVDMRTYRARGNRNALMSAVNYEADRCAAYLLKLGLDPNQPDANGNLPLTMAAHQDSREIMKLLLAAGAHPDGISTGQPELYRWSAWSRTAIMAAVLQGNTKAVGMLLQAGADPSKLDGAAVVLADLMGYREIHDRLIQAGATKPKPYAFVDHPTLPRISTWQWEASLGNSKEPDWDFSSVLAGGSVEKPKTPSARSFPQPVTMAVVSLDEATASEEALLTAKLTTWDNVSMVERATLNQVLAEHRLAKDWGDGTGGHLRMGQLLGADVLILLRRSELDKMSIIETRIVAAATGLVLGSSVSTGGGDKLESWARDVEARLSRAASKLTADPADLTLISIPRIQSAQATPLGRSLEQHLSIGLSRRLTHSPGVLMLERSEMERMAAETDLSQTAAKLFTSGWILDGTVETPVGANAHRSFTLRLRLRRSDDGKGSQQVEVSGKLDSLAEAIDEAAARLLPHMEAPASTGWNAAAEADAYAKEAEWFARSGLWDESLAAASAAVALGAEPDRVLPSRMNALVQSVLNSEASALSDTRRIYGFSRLMGFRAPLHTPRKNDRELDAEDYIDRARKALDLAEAVLHAPEGGSRHVEAMLWFMPSVFDSCTAPLRLLNNLSSADEFEAELAELRTRLPLLAGKALALAKKRTDRPELNPMIFVEQIRHMGYWFATYAELNEALVQRLTEAARLEAPLSPQPLFAGIFKQLRFHIDIEGRQAQWDTIGTGGNNFARQLVLPEDLRQSDKHLDMLATLLDLLNAKSSSERLEHTISAQKIHLDLAKGDTSLSGPLASENYLPKNFGEKTVRYSSTINCWHEKALGDPLRYEHERARFGLLQTSWNPPNPGFRRDTKRSGHPRHLPAWRDVWMKSALLRAKYETGDDRSDSYYQMMRDLGYPSNLRELMAAASNPDDPGIAASEAEPDTPKLKPYTLKNFRIPVSPEDGGIADAHSDFENLRSPNVSPDSSSFWASNAVRYYEMSFAGEVLTAISRPPAYPGMEGFSVGSNPAFSDRYLAIPATFARREENSIFGICVWDRGTGKWSHHQIHGYPGFLAISGDHLGYSFAVNPKVNYEGGDGFLNDPEYWKGVGVINLQTKEEDLVVSNRRNPPVSPVDGVGAKSYSVKPAGSVFRIHNQFYDPAAKKWSKSRPAGAKDARGMSFDLRGRRWHRAFSSRIDDVRHLVLSSDRDSEGKKIDSETRRIPLDYDFDFPIEKLSATPETLESYQNLRHGTVWPSTFLTDQGIFLFCGPGYFFIPMENIGKMFAMNPSE